MEELTVFLLGVLGGLLTGIMPGIGPAHLLAVIYVWMTGWNPVHLMIFYIAYITIANFIDAVPSLYFGVPGEVSAVPASKESPRLANIGLTDFALKQCAIGRMLGSVVALGLSFYIISWLLGFPEIFSSRWQIAFYMFTLTCIILAGRNVWWQNLLFMIVGFSTSFIGYNYYTQQTYGTFGWNELYTGLPLLPVLIGVYVIPQLLQRADTTALDFSRTQTRHQATYLAPIARGTVVGYVLGLVPGLSFILGSTAAYTLERWWQRYWPSDQDTSVASVVASETASNTGSVSMLIPLLLFGIPIIASEAIIYDLMVDAGAVFTLGEFLKNNYSTLVTWFVVACVVGMTISWPLARYFGKFASRLLDPRFRWILLVLILTSLLVEAYHQQKVMLYVLAFVVSLVCGWLARNRDVMPFVFVFVLGPSIQSVSYNLIQLYL